MSSKIKHKKDRYEGDRFLISKDITVAMEESMLVYGANTNFMRQIPNLVDGLKPVERRVLYGMYLMGLSPKKEPIKSAKIVGDVMSRLHPHGDTSIYDVMVRMAQDWKMNILLVSPEASFGNQYGDGASAMRYTETRLTQFAWDCYFRGFKLDNVYTRPTYDNKSEEPEYLPARYPAGIFNGCFGIGSGIKVDIPPHNPAEVMEYALNRVKYPTKKLKPFYPDSPTGADIVDDGSLDTIFNGGAGKITYRGIIEIDYKASALILYNPPPMVEMDKIIKKVSKLRQDGIIKGMISMERQMVAKSAGLVYYFKKEIDLDEVRQILYKNTNMESTLPVKFIALDNYRETRYGFGRYVDEWIDIRRDYLHVVHTKELISVYEKKHTLETVLMIFEGKNAEKTIKYIREKNDEDVIQYLMEKFDISSLQAKTITNMSIGAFSKTSLAKYQKELPELEKEAKRLSKILNSPSDIDEIIITDLEDGIRKYGFKRRSRIIKIDGETAVPNTRHKVIVTSDGFAKKLPVVTDTIGDLHEGDIPVEIIEIDNTDDLMIVDKTGNIHKLPVHKIKNGEFTDKGEPIRELVKLKGDICAVLPKPNAEDLPEENVYLMMVTSGGMIKKTNVREFVNMKSTVIGMNVEDKDYIVDVKFVLGESNDIIVYTEEGMGMRYSSSEVKDTGRASKGINALNRDAADRIKGFCIVKPKDKFIFCLTEKGKAKKCDLKQFRSMKRDSKVLRLITLDTSDSINMIQTVKGKETFRVLMKEAVLEIPVKEISELPRLSKGNKAVPVRRGERIITVKENQ